MPKSFIAQISSRKRHLLYGTAVGVLMAIGTTEKVYAACAPAALDNVAQTIVCSGSDIGTFDALGGADVVTIVAGAVPASGVEVSGGTGVDTLTMVNGSLDDNLLGGPDSDTIIVLTGTIGDAVNGNTGDDAITFNAGLATDLIGADGDDQISMLGGSLNNRILGGTGDDTIVVVDSTIEDDIFGDDGDDVVTFAGTSSLGDDLNTGEGNDIITVAGGTILDEVNGGTGDDQITITGGFIGNDVRGEVGDDTLFIAGAVTIVDDVRAQTGNDTIVIGSGVQIGGNVQAEVGNDLITMTGGSINDGIFGADGNDIISILGGSVTNQVLGGTGNDQLTIAGGNIQTNVIGEDGNDTIVVAGGSIGNEVKGNSGNDTISVTGGGISNDVEGDDGNDSIFISGGSVGEEVEGKSGNDLISISGGSIGDDVEGEAGDDSIFVSGGAIALDIKGDTGADSLFISGGSMQDVFGGTGNDLIEISGTADLQSDVISGNAGNDMIRVATVADLSGADILGEDGNDVIELAGASGELSGVDSLFGGSGSNDIAQFSGFTGVNAESFGGFEQMLLLNGTTLDVHNPNAVPLNDATLGALASGVDPFIVFTDPTSTLFAGGTSPGDTTVVGNYANLGQISMQDGTANDLFTITGAYAGGGTGTLAIDAELDITEIGDEFFLGTVANVDVPPPIGPTLVTPGSVAEGTTAVVVDDVGDGIGQLTGNQAGDGIAVIDVSGGSTDEDDFFLVDGPIQAGAVEYSLVLESDNIWYLQSEFLDQVFGYAGAPSAILTMARDYMGNLHERVGSLEQTWTGGATQISDGSGVWLRSGGFFGKVDSGKDEQEFDYKQDHWFAQVGADLALLSDASTGQLIGSIMGHAGYSNTRHDENGNELITENFIHSYGGGVALTWYGGPAGGWAGEGMYVDGIAQVTFYDLETKTEAEGKRGETDGWGWSIGLEAGYGINIGGDRNGPRLVPQIQIVYSSVSLDDFVDEEGVDVEFGNADSLEGRFGVAIDSGKMWRSVNAYAEANVVHEFLGDTEVTVTTLPVDYDLGGTSVELGLGGTVSLLDNVHLYADVDYLIPFNDGRQGASVIGGLRIAF